HGGGAGAPAILAPLPRLPLMGPAVRPAMARPGELTATAARAVPAGSAFGLPPPPAEHAATRSMTAPSSAPASRNWTRARAVVMAPSWHRSGWYPSDAPRRGRVPIRANAPRPPAGPRPAGYAEAVATSSSAAE